MALPDISATGLSAYLNDAAAAVQESGLGSFVLTQIQAHPFACIVVPCAAAAAGITWHRTRQKTLTQNFVRNLCSIQVESPFEDNAVLPLKDVLFALARSERDVLDICRSYGLTLPRAVFRADGAYSLLDAVKQRRRLSVRLSADGGRVSVIRLGELCGEGQPFPTLRIQPRSRLALMRSWLRGAEFGTSSGELYRQAVERRVREKIEESGFRVLDSERYFAVSRRFFEKTKMPFAPCPENPNFGLLNIVTRDDARTGGARAARRYGDNVPVIADSRGTAAFLGAGIIIYSLADFGIAESEPAAFTQAACADTLSGLSEDILATLRAGQEAEAGAKAELEACAQGAAAAGGEAVTASIGDGAAAAEGIIDNFDEAVDAVNEKLDTISEGLETADAVASLVLPDASPALDMAADELHSLALPHLGDIAGLDPLQLHAVMVAAVTSYQQFSLYSQGKVTLDECMHNITTTMAEKVVLPGLQFYTATAVIGALGLEPLNAAGNVLGGAASGLTGGGFDIDLGDLAEIAGAIAVIGLVFYGIKKLWDTIFDPYDRFRQLMAEKSAITEQVYRKMSVDHEADIDLAMKPAPQIQACISECEALEELLKKSSAKPLSWYVFEEKLQMLDKVRLESSGRVSSMRDHLASTGALVRLYSDMAAKRASLESAKERLVRMECMRKISGDIKKVKSFDALEYMSAQLSEKFVNAMLASFRMERFEDVAALAGQLQAKSAELGREVENLKQRKKL